MLKRTLRLLFGVIFVAAGVLHFIYPDYYARVMPPYFLLPLFWVLLSGVLEIAGGVGLFLKRFRRRAAQGLALLMVAFMPVHLHMLFYPADVGAEAIAPYLLFWRVALQFVFIAMFVWLAGEA
jgi:uncharacterized membrane protein